MVVSIMFDQIAGAKHGNDGDFVDRLNHRYTSLVFIFAAIFAMSTQLLGAPIACWTPLELHPGWQVFVENLCFVNQTYFVDEGHHVAAARRDGDIVHVWYYQWYPVIIAMMAMLFFIPQNIWTGMLGRFELDMNQMVNTVDNAELVLKKSDRDEKLNGLVDFMGRHFDSKGKQAQKPGALKKCLGALCNPQSGAYMGTFYWIIKWVYLAITLGQLFMLNEIIGPGTWRWGFEVIGDQLAGNDWTDTWRFPMTTFCDFRYYESLGNVHQQTVQCVLAVNLYNEKIFLFIWFWLWLMVCVNAYSVVHWFLTLYMTGNRFSWIEKHVMMADRTRKDEDKIYKRDRERQAVLRKFVTSYLKPDGVFMLRLISANTTSLNTTDIVDGLFKRFVRKPSTHEKFPCLDDIPTAFNTSEL